MQLRQSPFPNSNFCWKSWNFYNFTQQSLHHQRVQVCKDMHHLRSRIFACCFFISTALYLCSGKLCSDNYSKLGCPKDEGDGDGGCFCDFKCMQQWPKTPCCLDFFDTCLNKTFPTCKGLCEQEGIAPNRPCQCGPKCLEDFNCCPDYNEMCLIHHVSNEEIEDMAESLLFWEKNELMDSINLNLQGTTDLSCQTSNASTYVIAFKSDPMYSATYKNLIELYGDYEPDITKDETLSFQKLSQQHNLMTSVLETELMKAVRSFLVLKGFAVDNNKFNQQFSFIWFDYYKRSAKAANEASSGFEHVFLGETTPADGVKGFHNWVYLTHEYKSFVYHGYLEYLELNHKASIAKFNFEWRDQCKPESSMFIGTSPEFEFALYTLCWYTRPNSLCPVVLGGHRLSIQTYEHINHVGRKFVAAAYPVLSDATAMSLSFVVVSLSILVFKFFHF